MLITVLMLKLFNKTMFHRFNIVGLKTTFKFAKALE